MFCPGFLFWDKFQAISGPGQTKCKSPGFPSSAGNPEYYILLDENWCCSFEVLATLSLPEVDALYHA